MSKGRRILVTVFSVALLAIGFSAFTPATAQAATHCFASSCNGVDPIAGGCGGDARNLDTVTTASLTIQLRYSNTCNAAWVRLVAGNACSLAASGRVTNSTGASTTITAGQSCANYPDYPYSLMVSDTTGQTAYACGTVNNPLPANNQPTSACTRSI